MNARSRAEKTGEVTCKQKTIKNRVPLIGSVIAAFGLLVSFVVGGASQPSLSISQVPLEIAITANPQVLIALGNSESMDGTLSGAIMVGSGAVATSLNSLQNSSSPVNYTVPTGFSPPVQAAVNGVAPYTVTQNSTLVDNGPSRLNVAKAGIKAIIQTYMQNTNFALETYSTSNSAVYTTWVYYLSPPGSGFKFASTLSTDLRFTVNPCYNYSTASANIKSYCTTMASLFGTTVLSTNQYIQIGASSDDPSINDVLYASGQPGLFVSYAGPNPASPFPPSFSLANYNNGSVLIRYTSTSPSFGGFATAPTNAGYVPYATQVMYAQRGFGYAGSQSATKGNILVPMTTAGANPTTSSINTAVSKFTPYLSPETNSNTTSEIKAIAGQAPLAGLLTTAKTYLTGLPSNGCNPKLYVVLISDGLPTQDLNGASWPPLGSAAAAGYGVTATFNSDGSLNTTNNQALKDAITALTNLSNAGIKTFVIGLGAGVDPTINPQAAATLKAMAIAGGTDNYYPATSPDTLVDNLNNILVSVQKGSLSTTAAAISSTNLQIGTVEYQASFIVSDEDYQDWTGNLVEISLDPKTGFPTGTNIWSVQGLLDSNNSRLIATWDPAANGGAGGGIPFQWGSLSTTLQAALQPSDTLGANRLQYLRGDSSKEIRKGGTFRNRTHLLGDIVGSRPIYVGPPSSPFLLSATGYTSFAQSNASRQGMIYVGANDGMLHAFNASNGKEVFAFIPNAVFANLYNLTAPLYNRNHMYFVNGSPQAADVQFSDASWHSILVGGENGGGKSIYALDITNPAALSSETILASKVLWEFTDADMGLSFSQPAIGQINTTSTSSLAFAVFFGNGYNSPNNNAVLYAVNPQTGKTIKKINLCTAVPSACNASQPQGLSSVALAQTDGLQGQPISTVYAGDLQGNMWAVDVSDSSAASWTARLIFQAKDSAGNAQSITTTPVVTLNPSYPRFQGLFVMFGTGQLITQNDLTTQQTQSIYGVWDKPGLSLVLKRANLQSQTLSLVTAAVSGLPQNILLSTANKIAWNTQYGWYTDLPGAAQRSITNPQLLNGSYLATLNTPPTSTCGSASSMFLDINYATGGAFTTPQLDISNKGTISTSDTYQGQNPVGISLGNGYASSPASVGPNSSNYMVHIITMSGGQQASVINVNNSIRQTGWWQIQ